MPKIITKLFPRIFMKIISVRVDKIFSLFCFSFTTWKPLNKAIKNAEMQHKCQWLMKKMNREFCRLIFCRLSVLGLVIAEKITVNFASVKLLGKHADWNCPPWPGTIVSICMSFIKEVLGKEHGTNKPPPTRRVRERSKGDTTRPTTS